MGQLWAGGGKRRIRGGGAPGTWRDAPQDRLDELTRLASAAMACVADGEMHARREGPAYHDEMERRVRWAETLRPDTGRLGWRAAIQAVTSGRVFPEDIEP